jgi:SLOG cluster3 family
MTQRIFLSASVPVPGRGDFHESANPFLIQFAIRELLTVCLGRRILVWGGHPAITPMVWAVCEDLDVAYSKAVVLYQSKLFADVFPAENQRFANCVYVDAVDADRAKSLEHMRMKMLSQDFEAGVFIGGMEGIADEHQLFANLHPNAKVIAVASPGGAAQQLAAKLGQLNERIDFARMFYEQLGVDIAEPRDKVG